jgi:hypothetical protein
MRPAKKKAVDGMLPFLDSPVSINLSPRKSRSPSAMGASAYTDPSEGCVGSLSAAAIQRAMQYRPKTLRQFDWLLYDVNFTKFFKVNVP